MTSMLINMMLFTFMMSSFIFMMLSKHPIYIGILLIFQSMSMSMFMTKMFSISWFSFLIFIIYLGGILMIFSYMISLTKTKKKMMKNNKTMILISVIMMYISTYEKSNLNFFKKNMEDETFIILSSSMKLTIFFTTFLIIIMIMAVFLSESSKGNFRTS